MRLAAHVLQQHELFHFAVDYMAAMWELTQLRPCWKPARELRNEIGYIPQEEQLANAYMLRRLNAVGIEAKGPGRAMALKRMIRLQPVGYRDAEAIRENRAFYEASRKLCIAYLERGNGGPVPEEAFAFPATELLALDRIEWRHCPIHVVHDEKRFALPEFLAQLFSAVPWVNESDEFVKQLGRLDGSVQKAWGRTKQKLATTVRAQGLDFKLWARRDKGAEFSVRVDRSYRAHLMFEHRTQNWTAVGIGSHAAMRHG